MAARRPFPARLLVDRREGPGDVAEKVRARGRGGQHDRRRPADVRAGSGTACAARPAASVPAPVTAGLIVPMEDVAHADAILPAAAASQPFRFGTLPALRRPPT